MERIIIRHVEATDAVALQQLYTHPTVYRDTLHLPLQSQSMWQHRLLEAKPGVTELVACIGDNVVGQLALELNQRVRRRHVATFGLGVDPSHHGKGVGSALMQAMIDICDNWAAIQRIELTVFTDNQRAIALYRKFGFVIEGTSRHFAVRDGKLVDAYHMARFHHD